jgi:transposase-like protein
MMTVTKKAVPKELLDSLLADYRKPEDLIGENGVLKQLTKLLVEKALEAELADHLGHGKNEPVENVAGNTRNGKSRKTLKGEFGELPIEIPRDRHGTFEPQLIPKHQTHWASFDDKILSLYARGMTVREIQSHLEEMYGTEVSPTRISSVTDAVIEEVKVWQLCIVHMVRNSLNYVSWKMRAEVAADLKRIYTSATVDEAEQMLGEFEDKWDDAYLPISQSWRRNWPRIIPFFDYPPEIRKFIYTTNAIESVNMSLRKITKNRGSFPSDEALLKLFYLALQNISRKWTMPIRDWKAALTRFTIQFEERLTNL